jgi:hypothetical protein
MKFEENEHQHRFTVELVYESDRGTQASPSVWRWLNSRALGELSFLAWAMHGFYNKLLVLTL